MNTQSPQPMFQRLLVPTDGSRIATRSIERAGTLAAEYDAQVHLLHVVDSMTLQLARADEGENWSARQSAAGGALDVLAGRGDRILSEATDALAAMDVPVTTAMRAGPPAETIAAYAEDADIDLTIVSDRGRNRIAQFFIGSIPIRLFRKTSLPLWVSKPGRQETSTDVDDVVFPVDGSDISEQTARYVGAIAGQYGATLHLVSVVDKRHPDLNAVREQLEVDSRAALASADEAVADSVAVTTTLRTGTPSKEILAHAEAVGTDLISMGSHRRRSPLGYLTMPVAERVLRRAKRPVMSLRTISG